MGLLEWFTTNPFLKEDSEAYGLEGERFSYGFTGWDLGDLGWEWTAPSGETLTQEEAHEYLADPTAQWQYLTNVWQQSIKTTTEAMTFDRYFEELQRNIDESPIGDPIKQILDAIIDFLKKYWWVFAIAIGLIVLVPILPQLIGGAFALSKITGGLF